MSQGTIVAAIELGTAFIKIVAASVTHERVILLKHCKVSSAGISKGKIVNYETLREVVTQAIKFVESTEKIKIAMAFISISDYDQEGFFQVGSVNIRSANSIVSDDDIAQAIEQAKEKELSSEYYYILNARNPFYIDGERVENPRHLRGEKLEVGYWNVYGLEKDLTVKTHLLDGLGIPVREAVPSSLASARMVTDRTDRKNGVLVIDIGKGTTDYVLYQYGSVVRSGVIPVGGEQLTNDIATGLRVTESKAEMIKTQHGNCVLDPGRKSETFWLHGDKGIGDREIPLKALHAIIELRMEELFMIIREELGNLAEPERIPAGIVLTGGSSMLAGITAVGAKVFHTECHIGQNSQPLDNQFKVPEMSTVLGVLDFVMQPDNDDFPVKREKSGVIGLFKKILSFS